MGRLLFEQLPPLLGVTVGLVLQVALEGEELLQLAAHLAQSTCEGTLFLFDEPTTGLHFDDIAKLLQSFERLIHNGGSILLIEHNLDLIQAADWIIDLGPEGGEAGGHIIAEGTPEAVANVPESYTGKYLKQVLTRRAIA